MCMKEITKIKPVHTRENATEKKTKYFINK